MRSRGRALLEADNNGSGSIAKISAGETKELMRFEADQTYPPQNITVTICVRVFDGATYMGRNTVNLSAKVTWGNGRGGGEAVVDVARSTVFSVTAAWTLSVSVTYAPSPAEAAPPMIIEGACVYGVGVSIPPVMSQRLPQLAAGATSARVIVPSFARTVRLACAPAAARNASLMLRFYQENSGGPEFYGQDLQSPTAEAPVISGAEFYDINNATLAALDLVPVWTLAL